MDKQRHFSRLLSLGLVGLSLVGCTSDAGRTVINQNGETTTVIEATDAIKPQKGAAKLQKTLENFEGYGWVDAQTLVGYQFAASVFGDDRGIAYSSLDSGETKFFSGFEGKPQMAGLSLDGTKLALVKEGTARTKPLVVLDLITQKVQSYQSSMAFTPWQFNWFEDGSGAALTPVDSLRNRLSLLSAEGDLSEMDVSYSPKKRQGEGYISLGTGLGKRAEAIYFLVYSDDPGLYQYSLESHKSTQVLAHQTISQFALAHGQDYMAITSYKKSGTGSELFIYSLEGKLVYELYKALNFSQLVWSRDGKALVFEAIEASGESSLYLANMETGQTHFLGSYKGYSVKQLAFDSEGKRLMVSFVNDLAEPQRIDTQIFGLGL